ncbi:MAG: hypothetical protein CSYNP_01290 [Syntrophus sp. SKADARSKE-3]|nr:hypothetical protein [Syntrophus sp. SKADARSKE-3]
MAEIKSTLDLIMERTKNLTVTEEEKKAFRHRELAGKIKGFVLQYLDGLKDSQDFRRDFIEGHDDEETAVNMLRTEALSRIDPYGSNEQLLTLLKDIARMDTKRLMERINSFQSDLEQKREDRKRQLLKTLREDSIFGSAVRPNTEKDAVWHTWLNDAKEHFQKTIQRIA